MASLPSAWLGEPVGIGELEQFRGHVHRVRVDFGEVRRRFAFGDVQRLEQDHPLARQAGLVDSPSPIGRLNSRLEVSPVEVQILAAQGAPAAPPLD